MSSFFALAITAFAYFRSTNGADLGCKVYIGNNNGLRPNPIGVCLTNYINASSIIGSAVAVSQQYACEQKDDGTWIVNYEIYNNTDCSGDAYVWTEVSSDQDYIDCESSGCPIFEARYYAAYPELGSSDCTPGQLYSEISYLTDVCLTMDGGSYEFQCSDTALYYWSFSSSDCSGSPTSNSAIGIIEQGCDSSGLSGLLGLSTGYYEVQACSGCNVYSVVMVFVVVTLSQLL